MAVLLRNAYGMLEHKTKTQRKIQLASRVLAIEEPFLL